MCFFKVELQHIIARVPQRLWNSFSLEKNGWPFYCPLWQSSVLMLPTECVQTQEVPCRLPKILLCKLTSWVARWKRFLIPTRQVRKFSFLIGFFFPDYLQSEGHSQRFWSLHPSLRPAVFREWVVSMLVRRHHSVFCFLYQRFLSILRWCWLGLLLLKVCKIDCAFQPTWEFIICKNLRTPDFNGKAFSIWGRSVFVGNFESWQFVVILLQMKWFGLEIQIASLQNGTFQMSVSILLCECTGKLPKSSG